MLAQVNREKRIATVLESFIMLAGPGQTTYPDDTHDVLTACYRMCEAMEYSLSKYEGTANLCGHIAVLRNEIHSALKGDEDDLSS
jgi:hypothetical protein